MRSFSSILALSALAVGAIAQAPACMNDKAAQQVATNFKDLIAAYSDELADAALTEDFTDYSDAVTELINSGCQGPMALGQPTFNNLTEFEAGQSAQPPIPFEQLNLWHTCDTVIIRWRSAQTPEIVTGNIVMEAEEAPAGSQYPWKISTVYSEFNSGAWLVNLGVFVPDNCTAATQPDVPAGGANSTAPIKMMKRGLF